jgi:hypothetical protein
LFWRLGDGIANVLKHGIVKDGTWSCFRLAGDRGTPERFKPPLSALYVIPASGQLRPGELEKVGQPVVPYLLVVLNRPEILLSGGSLESSAPLVDLQRRIDRFRGDTGQADQDVCLEHATFQRPGGGVNDSLRDGEVVLVRAASRPVKRRINGRNTENVCHHEVTGDVNPPGTLAQKLPESVFLSRPGVRSKRSFARTGSCASLRAAPTMAASLRAFAPSREIDVTRRREGEEP